MKAQWKILEVCFHVNCAVWKTIHKLEENPRYILIEKYKSSLY